MAQVHEPQLFQKISGIPKKDVYDKIIELMEEAGWVNQSSNELTDFAVMTSDGEDGDLRLIYRLSPRPSPTDAGKDCRTTDYAGLTFYIYEDYIPGESGESGTFIPSNKYGITTPFHAYPMNDLFGNVGYQLSKDFLMDIYYYINKDRVFLIFQQSTKTVSTWSCFILFGIPEEYYDNVANDNYLSYLVSNCYGYRNIVVWASPPYSLKPEVPKVDYYQNDCSTSIVATTVDAGDVVDCGEMIMGFRQTLGATDAIADYIRGRNFSLILLPKATTLKPDDILVDHNNNRYLVLQGPDHNLTDKYAIKIGW